MKESANVSEFIPKLKEKRWDKGLEPVIFEQWQKQQLYAFKPDGKPVFSIDTPPPYVNTPVHIGQAYTYVLMDVIARFKRMCGFNVLFPIGLDKNGLPIEVQAEKAFGISLHSTPREEFIEKCKQLIEEAGDISLDTFRKLGISFNSWQRRYALGGKYDTDDAEYRRLTQETFIALWKRGLIYEDLKPTNYCPICRTSISDAEVEYKEVQATLHYIRFKVKETGESITIATTRPELLCTCKVVLFNPGDERYKRLKGKTAVVPLFGLEVPIIEHPYAKPDFGSGLVMICSFGDYSDVRLLRELDLNPTYAIDEEGKMNENAGAYKGLSVQEARKRIVQDLRAAGLLEKQEQIMQRQPICWRSKNAIEFVPMREFYLKQIEHKEDILALAEQMRFTSPRSKQILIDWVNSINIDWVISRRRYYGTEIPLWYCRKCKAVIVPEPGKYYQPWKEQPPVQKCPKCGCSSFEGEKRVLDTWFDSSNSQIYISGYLWDKDFFAKHYPCTLRPQGKEIVRTWLYFSLLKSLLFLGKRAFDEVWIHYHVVDETGRKMSKSLGNVIDPQELLQRYGAEAFRIWTCLEGDITQGDIRCSFERIEGTSKFLTKLWNIARFISMFPQPNTAKLMKSDEWILAELSKLVKLVHERYAAYAFFDAVTEIRNFAWNLFAAHYVELVKTRAYGSGQAAEAAWHTLHTCMRTLLLLLAPVIPHITEHIWQKVYAKRGSYESIHTQSFPEAEWKTEAAKYTQPLTAFNSKVWNTKKAKGMSLRDPIKIKIPDELKPFEADLRAMHNIRNVEKRTKGKK